MIEKIDQFRCEKCGFKSTEITDEIKQGICPDCCLGLTQWVSKGGWIIRRDALDYEDKDSWWQQWKQKFNEEIPYSSAKQIYPDMKHYEYLGIINRSNWKLAQDEMYG